MNRGTIEYGCSTLSDIVERHPNLSDIYLEYNHPAVNIAVSGEMHSVQIGGIVKGNFIPKYSTPWQVMNLGESPQYIIESQKKLLGVLMDTETLIGGESLSAQKEKGLSKEAVSQ